MGSPLLQSYLHHCDQQGWRKDNCQIKLIEKIDDWMVQQTLLRRLRGMAKQGFYLHGPVGRGKCAVIFTI